MKLFEAKDILRDTVAAFFGPSHVFYADQKMARKPEPYVTIKVNSYIRAQFPTKIITADGYEHSYYRIDASVDINLYTKGIDVSNTRGTPVYANTALDDMDDFVDYLVSDAVTEKLYQKGCTVILGANVKDLSALQNESQYQYRSMIEVRLIFTDVSYGRYGQNGNVMPNASGGGNSTLMTEPSVIEDVQMEEKADE